MAVWFEAICLRPETTILRLWQQAGPEPATPDRRAAARALVKIPSSLGRWRQAEAGLQAVLKVVGRRGLICFGYGEQD